MLSTTSSGIALMGAPRPEFQGLFGTDDMAHCLPLSRMHDSIETGVSNRQSPR
jgi:hypothetical protein